MYEMTHSWPHRAVQASFGLSVGFGASETVHTLEEVTECARGWMVARAEAGLPFLTGTFSAQRLVYAYPSDGAWVGGVEDSVLFTGAPALYNASQDADCAEMLVDLASRIAHQLGQLRFIVFVNGTANVFARRGVQLPE